MKRSLGQIFLALFSNKSLLVIKSIKLIKNWFPFLLNYSGLCNRGRTFKLRDGTIIKVSDGFSCSSIGVVYLKHEYGDVDDNSTIIDIGANIGAFSIYCTKHHENNKAYAFEPSTVNYQYLLENIEINKLGSRIVPFKYAVGARNGKAMLTIQSTSLFHSLYKIESDEGYAERSDEGVNSEEVDCITLKDIIDLNQIERCDLLKLDCEGAEYDILYNLPVVYLGRIKRIAIECHKLKTDNPEYNYKGLMNYLSKNGFEIKQFGHGIFWATKRW